MLSQETAAKLRGNMLKAMGEAGPGDELLGLIAVDEIDILAGAEKVEIINVSRAADGATIFFDGISLAAVPRGDPRMGTIKVIKGAASAA